MLLKEFVTPFFFIEGNTVVTKTINLLYLSGDLSKGIMLINDMYLQQCVDIQES